MKDIELASGVQIRLSKFEQRYTYEGLLEGLPTREMNARILAKSRGESGTVVLEPRQTPLEDAWPGDKPYPFGTPAVMPAIKVTAWFKSDWVRDPKLDHYTHLIIVWFQDEFGYPFTQDVIEQVRTIDWRGLANVIEL